MRFHPPTFYPPIPPPSAWAWGATLLLGALSVAQALDKPPVQVRFQLQEPVYRASFSQTNDPATGTSELRAFEAAVAEGFTALFSNEVGFVRFVTEPVALQLHVQLQSEEAAIPGFEIIPTFFRLEFGGLDTATPVPALKWKFRDPQDYGRGVDPETFAGEVLARMGRQLAEHDSELVAAFLSHVSLGREVCLVVDGEDVYCAIPFGYPDLQAAAGTLFQFETRKGGLVPKRLHHFTRGIDVPLARIPGLPYAEGLLAEEGQSPPASKFKHTPLKIFKQPDKTILPLPVQGLYVMRYVRHLPVVVEEHNPSSVVFP